MLYDIQAKIRYKYKYAVGSGHHTLRLLPMNIEGRQRLISGGLIITPAPAERLDRFDFFGNAVTDIAFRDNHRRLEFKCRARVEILPQVAQMDYSEPLENLHLQLHNLHSLRADSPNHYVAASTRVQPHAETTAFAQSVIDTGAGVLDIVTSIGAAIHREMHFDPEATSVETPLLDAFKNRHGVCQDFSHIMIACLRGLGIPAAYVSGFIRTNPPAGEQRLAGVDAMHAWVAAWCGEGIGWIEYDPTNAMYAGQDHVLVAKGRDYADVSPVKGVLRSSSDAQESSQAVDVLPVSE